MYSESDKGQKNSAVVTANPFEGLKNGDERLAKAKLAIVINQLLQGRGLNEKAASELLGITQPEVSQIANGRLSEFTFDRLCRCLQALDISVEITLKKRTPAFAGIHVHNELRI